MISLIVLSAIISGILYRAGGLSKEEKSWIPVWMRHSWVRDWLCPMCVLLFFIPQSWFQLAMWLCAYGVMGGMLSTYWDWLFKKDTFWFAGLCVGLALLFLIGLGVAWGLIVARAAILGVSWGILCANTGSADIEEYGRGSLLVLTLLTMGV